MEGVKYARRNGIPEPIGFRVGGVTNKYERVRTGIDLRGRRLGKGECAATNFAQVGEGWRAAKPEFEGGAPSIGCGSCQGGEVRCGKEEFVPEEAGSVARKAHGASLFIDRPVESLDPPVLR